MSLSAFPKCVVVVDPISTGGSVAAAAKARGYTVVAVWNHEITHDLRMHVPPEATDLEYFAEIDELPTIAETAAALREVVGSIQLVACIVGGESGVTLADALSEELGLRTNGSNNLPGARRNKSVQQQCVRGAGLRAVREACGTRWSDVAAFLDTEPLPVVVKPVESAGSDGVKLCNTKQEAEVHFTQLMASQQRVGSQGAAVLVQEFLRGKEYVIDHVSCDGVHKTMMVWVYDKRPTNGAQFVYYGVVPVEADSPIARILIEYTRGVLDALKIRNGATHGEVMMTEDGPCLVEMNCRCAGCDGALTPVQEALVGYSQVGVTLDAFLDQESFASIPSVPRSFMAAGQMVFLVSVGSGKVLSTPGYDKIQALPSFSRLFPSYGIGDDLVPSTDLFTIAGLAILVHADTSQLERDIELIRDLERDEGLFDMEKEEHSDSELSTSMESQSGAVSSSSHRESEDSEVRSVCAEGTLIQSDAGHQCHYQKAHVQ